MNSFQNCFKATYGSKLGCIAQVPKSKLDLLEALIIVGSILKNGALIGQCDVNYEQICVGDPWTRASLGVQFLRIFLDLRVSSNTATETKGVIKRKIVRLPGDFSKKPTSPNLTAKRPWTLQFRGPKICSLDIKDEGTWHVKGITKRW